MSQPSYAPLIIEYVTEGREGSQRGYTFTSSTRGYSEQDLKMIWQRAMPRGQGWAQYIGARSLKCFRLASGRVAISNVQVTDQQDESGRRGIRRAEVATLSQGEYSRYLRELWDTLPEGIQNDARFQWDYWRKLRSIESQIGRIRRKNQLILSHLYLSMTDWQVIEGIMLYVGLRPSLLSVFSSPFDWTSLALDYQDEGPVVAVPQQVMQKDSQKSAESKGFAVISV